MKEISQKEKNMIEVYTYESRKPLPAAVLEKDILLTELLRYISDLQPRGYNCALCGGTALSKGYRVTERMSEDIDLKVFVPHNESAKTALSCARAQIRAAIERAGFDGNDCRACRDNEFSFRLRYDSRFSSPTESLRPRIQVECINITPFENPQLKRMRSIVGEHFDNAESFEMPCTTLREILVEKTAVLLRRMHDGKHENPQLMRHVYDLNQIIQTIGRPDDQKFHSMFAQKVAMDVAQYAGDSSFCVDPKTAMESSLLDLQRSPTHAKEYDSLLRDLIIHSGVPSYEKALAKFLPLAGDLIARLDSDEKFEEKQNNWPRLRIR